MKKEGKVRDAEITLTWIHDDTRECMSFGYGCALDFTERHKEIFEVEAAADASYLLRLKGVSPAQCGAGEMLIPHRLLGCCENYGFDTSGPEDRTIDLKASRHLIVDIFKLMDAASPELLRNKTS